MDFFNSIERIIEYKRIVCFTGESMTIENEKIGQFLPNLFMFFSQSHFIFLSHMNEEPPTDKSFTLLRK